MSEVSFFLSVNETENPYSLLIIRSFFPGWSQVLTKILGLPVLILKCFLLTQIIPRNQNIMLIINSFSASVGLLQ